VVSALLAATTLCAKSTTPLELILRIINGFFDFYTSAESSRTQSDIRIDLSCSFDLQGNSSFFLSPSNGELGCPPSYPSLKQPLNDTFRVFNNPVKVLLLGFSFKFRTQRVLFLVPIYTLSQCPPGRVFSHKTPNSSVLFCAPNAPAQCPPSRALRILSDSGSPV
jgi:hypothetical protein